ncbi:Pleckstrin homology domain-containing protein [Kalaharituber pfeilii]|nr:Pleckstrin homology domain-containing protein [Kalaharituber pfeilii]
MSESKPEEVPALAEAPKVPGAPTLVEATPAEEPAPLPSADAPAPAEDVKEQPQEESKEDAKEEPAEIKTISEGWLEFKPHGILHNNSFIPTKKFFYLQDEPITVENLSNYIKKEKPEVAHPTAAYASQTGKGLLFYTKSETQKANPIGIIKLADVVDVTASGNNKFALKLQNDVWNFEAAAPADRDSWVDTIKGKVTEAKEGVETITSSEGYKSTLDKFSKKAVSGKTAETAKEKEGERKDDEEEKKEEEKEEKEEKKEEKKEDKKKEEKKEEKKKEEKKEDKKKEKEKAKKSDDSSDSSSSSEDEGGDKKGKKVKRSNSAKKSKRTSFFAGIIPHKEKKSEKEEKKEEKIEEKPEEGPKAEEPTEGAAEASTEAPAPATEEPTEEIKSAEEPAKPAEPAATEEVTASKGSNKRHSFFGLFDKKKESDKASEHAKKEVVSDAPPVIAPIGEETAEETKPVETSPAPPVDTGAKCPSSPPKESFLDKLFKPKEKGPAATVPAHEAKKEEEATETVSEPKPADTEAVKDTEEKAPEASSKDAKRRSSFFASLSKKDKKPDVKSDTEEEPSSSKSNPTSPIPKKLSLFRKNSKSAKDAPKDEKKEEVPPVPVIAPVATEPPAPAATSETTAPVEETPAAAETTTSIALLLLLNFTPLHVDMNHKIMCG